MALSLMHEVLFATLTSLLLLTLLAIFLLPPTDPSRYIAILDLILIIPFWIYIIVLIIKSRNE